MTIKLRYYQQDAIESTLRYLHYDTGNPVIVIPTGGGKTPVMAELCRLCYNWNYRVIVLSHVKELIEQTYNTIKRNCPDINIGIYSAGLKSRDTNNQILVAGIQSVFKRAEEIGKLNLIIVDEAHLIPPDSQTRYQTFLRDARKLNPKLHVVGLTATPYRTNNGLIYGKGMLFSDKAYEIRIPDLIASGFLSHIRSKNGKEQADLTNVKKTAGDFDLSQMAEIFSDENLLNSAIDDIISKAQDRKKILVFCPKIDTCRDFKRLYEERTGEPVYIITGDTDSTTRAEIINNFRNEDCRVLANCQVLTTGFDAPNVDCVVLLRATVSPGLYYQMVGRGFRICPGKKDCLILDYGRNIERHGPVDSIKPHKKRSGTYGESCSRDFKFCPECGECIQPVTETTCPSCGYEFPPQSHTSNLEETASEKDILSNDKTIIEEFDVTETIYNEPTVKKGLPENAPRYIRVDYKISSRSYKSEWLCIEYDGYPRTKFEKWYTKRVCPEIVEQMGIPLSCTEFQKMVQWKAIAETKHITVKTKPDERFGNVTKSIIGDIPTYEQVNRYVIELQKREKERRDNPDLDSYDTY